MITVALVGPDGSGKSLVTKRLLDALPELPMKRVYMGINLEASNIMLPTTWLLVVAKRAGGGRPDMAGPYEPDFSKPASKNPLKRVLAEIKAWALLINRVAEEWYRQFITWIYLKRGYHVLFDRHFVLDYYFHDMQYNDKRKPITRRIHGYLLSRFYPRPHLVICLDAPAEVLFARKSEGTVEILARRRLELLSLCDVLPAFQVVDATQPVEQVIAQTAETIRAFIAAQPKSGQQRLVKKPSAH